MGYSDGGGAGPGSTGGKDGMGGGNDSGGSDYGGGYSASGGAGPNSGWGGGTGGNDGMGGGSDSNGGSQNSYNSVPEDPNETHRQSVLSSYLAAEAEAKAEAVPFMGLTPTSGYLGMRDKPTLNMDTGLYEAKTTWSVTDAIIDAAGALVSGIFGGLPGILAGLGVKALGNEIATGQTGTVTTETVSSGSDGAPSPFDTSFVSGAPYAGPSTGFEDFGTVYTGSTGSKTNDPFAAPDFMNAFSSVPGASPSGDVADGGGGGGSNVFLWVGAVALTVLFMFIQSGD